MRRTAQTPLTTLLFLFLAVVCNAQDPEFIRHFDYDKKAPIGFKELGVETRGDVQVHDITFVSPKGGVVPAYLVTPKGSGPFAAVVWGHWYWDNSEMRNRKEFLDEAVALASVGVVSLLPDGPIARPGFVADKDPLSPKHAAEMVQSVVDIRRGIDLLLDRKDVDPKRLVYVGHSYGASVGAFLSGVDRRAKAYVLMAGPLSDEVNLKSAEYRAYRDKLGPEKFDAYFEEYKWLDEGKYVSHAAPAFVFMQFETQENS